MAPRATSQRSRALFLTASLLFACVIFAAYSFLTQSLDSLEPVRHRLRGHRAAPLPRRRQRKLDEEVSTEEQSAAAEPWYEALPPFERDQYAALRLSEVGVQVLSWAPRIFHLHNLLTPEECDELVALARPRMEASTVVDTATGQGMLSQVRTSSGMFIMENTPLTRVLRRRVSHLSLLPEENAESIQILHYEVGQFYKV
jgi:hypothetical protein